jgi:GTP-binding protein HflX
VPIPTVSLVGYTNAGKSSLFNALTDAGVYTADQLFATLDPTMRRILLPANVSAILADTVGFIRQLPHDLIDAFRATLEEVVESDLLLHVVDTSCGDRRDMIEQVAQVLREIKADAIPQLIVFNKIDLAGRAPRIERDARGSIARVWVSAQTGAGIELLRQAVSEHFRSRRLRRWLRLPGEAARLRARIHERLHVVSESTNDTGAWLIEIALEPTDVTWLQKQRGFEAEYWVPDDSGVLAPTGS